MLHLGIYCGDRVLRMENSVDNRYFDFLLADGSDDSDVTDYINRALLTLLAPGDNNTVRVSMSDVITSMLVLPISEDGYEGMVSDFIDEIEQDECNELLNYELDDLRDLLLDTVGLYRSRDHRERIRELLVVDHIAVADSLSLYEIQTLTNGDNLGFPHPRNTYEAQIARLAAKQA